MAKFERFEIILEKREEVDALIEAIREDLNSPMSKRERETLQLVEYFMNSGL